MKKTILFLIITVFLMASCTSGEKPPTYSELEQQRQTTDNTVSKTDTEIVPETTDSEAEEAAKLREEHSKAAAAILTENRESEFATTIFGTQTAVECDGGIYIDCIGKIRLLNRGTGLLQGLCTDPLCKHESCIESHEIISMVSDGDKLYFKGYNVSLPEFSIKQWNKFSFLAYYDPKTDKFDFLETWEKDLGAVSNELSLHGGYLYYTKKMNEQTNSLFRIPTDGGQSERLTFKDEFVQQWTVTEEKIIYRTDAYTLKSMKPDGSDVEILDEFICMAYTDVENLYTISVNDENGYAVYQNGETLPDRVFSPVNTVLMDGALWYTLPDERTLGTYIDKNGKELDIKTYNGTSFYRYDLSTGERMEYDCPFSYGISEFCGTIGKYMLIKGVTEERGFSWWIFNPDDPNEAYRLYEY